MVLLLLAAVFLKSLVWWQTVPIFQTPDEQAHFAQLQWYAETKTLAINPEKNLSLEVATAEEILGTRRDASGNNRYTYHPEYRNHESVPAMPISARTTYVDKEAALYPPLYYLLSLPFYFGVYDADLTSRILAARVLPILLGLGLAWVAYKIGRMVWPDKFFAVVLAVLVSFQPMISFVSAGLHPDNLLNLLYSLGILVLLLVLKNGLNTKSLFALAAIVFLGLQTKVLMVFFLPLAGAVVVYKLFGSKAVGILAAAILLVLPIAAFLLLLPLPYMPAVTASSPLASMNFWEYLKFRGPKTLFEMWPWYWGVFKWLGVTLPPLVMKVITRLAILAGIGLVIRLWRRQGFEFKALIFFLLSTGFYYLHLVFWDWRLMQSLGYSQGLQGRYLFTNIVPQMALLLAGLTVVKRWGKAAAVITALAMVVLNAIALYTIVTSYS